MRGYEWIGENFKQALRDSRGVGFLVKTGIKFRVIRYEGVLIEAGRSIGIEINDTQVHVVYLPVNTDPQDKIIQHYEGLSEIIM